MQQKLIFLLNDNEKLDIEVSRQFCTFLKKTIFLNDSSNSFSTICFLEKKNALQNIMQPSHLSITLNLILLQTLFMVPVLHFATISTL